MRSLRVSSFSSAERNNFYLFNCLLYLSLISYVFFFIIYFSSFRYKSVCSNLTKNKLQISHKEALFSVSFFLARRRRSSSRNSPVSAKRAQFPFPLQFQLLLIVSQLPVPPHGTAFLLRAERERSSPLIVQ